MCKMKKLYFGQSESIKWGIIVTFVKKVSFFSYLSKKRKKKKKDNYPGLGNVNTHIFSSKSIFLQNCGFMGIQIPLSYLHSDKES